MVISVFRILMKKPMKKIFLPVLFLIVLLVLITGRQYFSSNQTDVTATDNSAKKSLNISAETEKKKDESIAVRNSPKNLKKKFETNEEIRQEYGRLEVVYLFSGKRYEGAVISIDNYYTMVTVNGIIRIRMEEVKARDIIK